MSLSAAFRMGWLVRFRGVGLGAGLVYCLGIGFSLRLGQHDDGSAEFAYVHRITTDPAHCQALRRYVMKELDWRKPEGTILLDDPPMGQEAQVDFGLMGKLVDETTGKRRNLWALLVTLSASRYMFVWPSWFQTTEAVCEGLDAAWAFFGGMPHTLVPDNMSSVVFKADALAPVLIDAFADYAQARGLFVDPARAAHPKDKPKVENQVRYVRDNWFAGEHFVDLQHAKDSARHWCAEVAGTRVHGTTRKVPREVFELQEKPAMLPPPTEPFDVPLWVDLATTPGGATKMM